MEYILWVLLSLLAIVWLGVVFRGAPYVPTLKGDLKNLFRELSVTEKDTFVDLGSGDGRVLFMAAEKGAKAVGYELNPFLVLFTKLSAWRRRAIIEVRTVDFWRTPLPDDTTIVFVFLADTYMSKLHKKLSSESLRLKRPLKLVSYGFALKGREPLVKIGACNVYEFQP